ncbi:hypothetical protein QUA13_24290 [Microcoleus sp. S28C3]
MFAPIACSIAGLGLLLAIGFGPVPLIQKFIYLPLGRHRTANLSRVEISIIQAFNFPAATPIAPAKEAAVKKD